MAFEHSYATRVFMQHLRDAPPLGNIFVVKCEGKRIDE